MAVTNPVDTVRGALRELLDSARENIQRAEGARGFPAALALFSVIDTIGSYHRGDATFTVLIDQQQHAIGSRRARDHIRILNSHYFGLTLTMSELKDLYSLARSPVTHNATLGPGLWLSAESGEHLAVESRADGIHVHLPTLLGLCERAVSAFNEVATKIIPNSLAYREIQAKAAPNESYDEQVARLAADFARMDPGQSISVTGVDSGRGRP